MTSQVLVVCKADAQLVSLDPRTLDVRWRTDLSDIGHEVVASPDGRFAYVPLYGTGGVGRPGRSGDGLDVFNLHIGTRAGTIPLPRGCRPHFAQWAGDGTLVVTAEGIGAVLAVDVTTHTAAPGANTEPRTRELPTGHGQTHMLATSRDGMRVYTADVCPGRITEIELLTREQRVLELATRINRISLSADGSEAYVADQDEPRIAVVDIRTMALTKWVGLPHVAFSTAALPDGGLLMAMRQARVVALLDPRTGQVTAPVPVPAAPQRVVLDPNQHTAYVTCSPDNAVIAIDVTTSRVVAVGAPGREPDGLALAS